MKLLIGCGKMGGAILDGWLQSGIKDIIVLARTPERAIEIKSRYSVSTILSIDELTETPEIILVAVKPYQLETVLPSCKQFDKSIFISVVVGKSIQYFQTFLGEQCLIIRTMPNIPCLIKQGVIGIYAQLKTQQRDYINHLLSPIGTTFWLKNENEIEIVAALSGGIPAFLAKILKLYAEEISTISQLPSDKIMDNTLHLFCEQKKLNIVDHITNGWASDGTLLGLDQNIATETVIRTIIGTIELLKTMLPHEIIAAVASKGGTTEAGLLAIEHGLSPIIAAYKRAIEINNT